MRRPIPLIASMLLLSALAAGSQAVETCNSPIQPIKAKGYDYVVACTQQLNIRSGPSLDHMVIARAEKGDLFTFTGENEEWFEVRLFSGAKRYLSKRYAAGLQTSGILAGHNLRLPATWEKRASLRSSVIVLTRQSRRWAEELLPRAEDGKRHETLYEVLLDQRLLELFHVAGTHSALFDSLMEKE